MITSAWSLLVLTQFKSLASILEKNHPYYNTGKVGNITLFSQCQNDLNYTSKFATHKAGNPNVNSQNSIRACSLCWSLSFTLNALPYHSILTNAPIPWHLNLPRKADKSGFFKISHTLYSSWGGKTIIQKRAK